MVPDPDSSRIVGIDISGKPVEGALGLEEDKAYYVFDFWNNQFLGKVEGASRLEQKLRPGEARMMSVRECLDRPQVLSTNRHIMQGYLDLVRVEWNEDRTTLTGVSKVVGGDPYVISLALNGFHPDEITVTARSRAHAHPGSSQIYVTMTGDRLSGRLLGAQLVGKEGVAHRINAPAVALHSRMTVEGFCQTDLAYAPPFGPVWDPMLTAANQLLKKL